MATTATRGEDETGGDGIAREGEGGEEALMDDLNNIIHRI